MKDGCGWTEVKEREKKNRFEDGHKGRSAQFVNSQNLKLILELGTSSFTASLSIDEA